MIKLIEKIEGEAKLDFHMPRGVIEHVDIRFEQFRGMEAILKGKQALDALVINPRVCGICGHAHLLATAQALEAVYENLQITPKAKIIRSLAQHFELIQNHFKWFYLTLFPLLGYKQDTLKAMSPSRLMAKAIAHFGGQYPHTSYAIVGGVACEITQMDAVQIGSLIDQTIAFFEEVMVVGESEAFLACENIEHLMERGGDLPMILQHLIDQELHLMGKSYDRFIAFGEDSYFVKGKAHKTRVSRNINTEHLSESAVELSHAKNVRYKGMFYEAGPLARAMIRKTPLVKDAHRRYGDSIFTRILARVCEIAQLLLHAKEQLNLIDLSQASYIAPIIPIEQMSGEGVGCVEAARGSLIHKVRLERGIIESYEIITPTQFNLGSSVLGDEGIAQRAMIGLSQTSHAELVFKSFDVCSVCTTH